MKSHCLALLFSLLCLMASAQTKSHNYTIKGNIAAIEAYGNVEIDYTIASKTAMSVKATGESLDLLKIEQKGSTLLIYTEGNYKKDGKIEVKLSAPAIYKFSVSGNADVEVKGLLVGKNTLDVNASGNAKLSFEGDVNVATIKFDTSANSDVSLENVNSGRLEIDSSGNSKVEAEDLTLETVSVDASGNSLVDLHGNATSGTYGASGNSTIDAYELKLSSGSVEASGNSTVRCNIANPKYNRMGNAHISNK